MAPTAQNSTLNIKQIEPLQKEDKDCNYICIERWDDVHITRYS